MSMVKAMEYYKSKGNLMLKGSEETINFIEFWNNLFDSFNRTLPWQGLRLNDDEGFQVNKYFIFIMYIYLYHLYFYMSIM